MEILAVYSVNTRSYWEQEGSAELLVVLEMQMLCVLSSQLPCHSGKFLHNGPVSKGQT